jgi:hypothetical protein
MSIRDTFELRNLRAAHRQERRQLLKTAGQALSQLQAAAPGTSASRPPGNKDYSDSAVLKQIAQRAQEATRNVDRWEREIADLERKVAVARKARTNAIIVAAVITLVVVSLVGYGHFHKV